MPIKKSHYVETFASLVRNLKKLKKASKSRPKTNLSKTEHIAIRELKENKSLVIKNSWQRFWNSGPEQGRLQKINIRSAIRY